MPVVIETEEENARMLAVVEKLMKKGENLSLEEEKLLKVFCAQVTGLKFWFSALD